MKIDNFRNKLSDDLSKEIYDLRCSYSNATTSDEENKAINELVDLTIRGSSKWKGFIDQLKNLQENGKMVLYGMGVWGYILYNETKDIIRWQYAVDREPDYAYCKFPELEIISLEDFKNDYNSEYVIVSSYKHFASIYSDLISIGIPSAKIINAGKEINAKTEGAIYFDLPEEVYSGMDGIFVDGGSYDGANTLTFFEKSSDNSKAICIEPDRKNVDLIQEKLNAYPDRYTIVNKALWSHSCTLGISESAGVGTKITDTGANGNISAVSIDELCKNHKISMIKMDIEGSELEALAGAEDAIKRDRPLLAISIYHKKEDIHTIPDFVASLELDYTYYLRHYSFEWYDTVFYAVPRRG